jgi:2-phosphosulfolactate phosphatase
MKKLEVLMAPAEFETLKPERLRDAVCVVFDVLRATSSMVAAFAHGADAILPVSEIQQALEARRDDPFVLLAGERHGLRIRAERTGGVDFDLGNSPREFTRDKVAGRKIVTTTTNGTRALRAAASARAVLISSFLNLGATARWVLSQNPADLIVVCGGTFEEAAFEDVLAAGALCKAVWPFGAECHISDSVQIAAQLYSGWRDNLSGAMASALNARRLLANPDLKDDVAYCIQLDAFDLVASLRSDGWIRVERPN